MTNFSSAVQNAMLKKKISVAQIARETGYSWSYINDLLKNKRRWNEDTMNKVGAAVGLSIYFRLTKAN